MKRLFLLLVAAPWLLSACIAAPEPRRLANPAPDQLRARLALLPGAEVSGEGVIVVRYPGESLFASGAVLPLPGGAAVLDPLADLLRSFPQLRWQGTVRAGTAGHGEYDLALAEKRTELLNRYFARRGVALEQLTLRPEASSGPSLELAPEVAQPASSASSSREKK